MIPSLHFVTQGKNLYKSYNRKPKENPAHLITISWKNKK